MHPSIPAGDRTIHRKRKVRQVSHGNLNGKQHEKQNNALSHDGCGAFDGAGVCTGHDPAGTDPASSM